MTVDEQIDRFFKKPHESHPDGSASALYLARQEAQSCLLGYLMPEDQAVRECAKDPQRVLAASMVILAAIDLMATLYAGRDEPGEAGRRTEAFARDFVFAGNADAETFARVLHHGCRHPLLRSFTVGNGTCTITVVGDSGRPGIISRPRGTSNQYVISVVGLYRAFVEACRRYEAAVRASTDLQAKFSAMFAKHGTIHV